MCDFGYGAAMIERWNARAHIRNAVPINVRETQPGLLAHVARKTLTRAIAAASEPATQGNP